MQLNLGILTWKLFIHSGNLCSNSSRSLLKGDPSLIMAKEKGLEQFVKKQAIYSRAVSIVQAIVHFKWKGQGPTTENFWCCWPRNETDQELPLSWRAKWKAKLEIRQQRSQKYCGILPMRHHQTTDEIFPS